MSIPYDDETTLNLLPEESGARLTTVGPEINLLSSPTAGESRDDVREVTDFQRETNRSSGWLRMT